MPKIYRPNDEKKREKAKYAGSITMLEKEASPEIVQKLAKDPSLFNQAMDTILSIGYQVKQEKRLIKGEAGEYKVSLYAQWADMKDAGMTLSVSTTHDVWYGYILICAIMQEYKFRLDIIGEDDVEF